MNDLSHLNPTILDDLTHLKPEWIMDVGVSTTPGMRPILLRLLRALLGYQHVASVRKFTRSPNKQKNGSGERNPIHKYELTFWFFSKLNLSAAILMRERFEYFYEVIMNEQSSPEPFDIRQAASELETAMNAFRAAAVAGEQDAQVLAQLLADIEAKARTQNRLLTHQQARKTREAVLPPINHSVPPVNWRKGQKGLR